MIKELLALAREDDEAENIPEDKKVIWENLEREIKDRAANSPSGTADMVIPEGMTVIPDRFFRKLPVRTVTIPKSMTKIPSSAFSECASLERVILHENVTEIGWFSFYQTGLQEIELPDSLARIGEKAFFDCKKLKKIVLPKKIKKIPCEAFKGCGLEEVVLPTGLRVIDRHAFKDCEQLRQINLQDVTAKIECGAFDYCMGLSEDPEFVVINGRLYNSDATMKTPIIELPPTVRVIGNGAFHNDDEISDYYMRLNDFHNVCTKVIVPETVESIERYAFSFSDQLREIDFKCKIPEIPYCAFWGSKKVKKIRIHKDTVIDENAMHPEEVFSEFNIKVVRWK